MRSWGTRGGFMGCAAASSFKDDGFRSFRSSADMSAADGRPSDFVCFAGQDWWYHNHAHSDVQLMRRVAEERKVLLVNSIGLRMPVPGRSTQVLRRLGRKLRS